MTSINQRFQSLKDYIDTELRGILAAFPGETEHVANEIDSLAAYIKDNLICDGSNAVAQSALVARVASDGQDVNSYAEPATPTANNFLDNCQPNGECVAEDEGSAANIHGCNATSGSSDNENGQSEESLAQTLSLICDEILATEKQDTVATTNGPAPSTCSGSEVTEKELMGQDSGEQDEGGAASAGGAREEQESEHESEEESQAQSSGKATTGDRICQRNSVTRARLSRTFASSEKLKRHWVAQSTGGSSNKRQRRFMTADMKEFKRKDISSFFKQTALIPKDFHQPEEIYGIFSERCSTDDPATIWLLTRAFFGTGSPNSFDQLSKICTTLRQNQDLPTLQTINSLRQVVKVLNSLNVHVEKLSISVLETLIEVLSEYRGVFLEAVCGKVSQIVTVIENRNDLDKRYKFENITEASLKKEPPDSSRFIEYCELDMDDLSRNAAESNDGPQESTNVSMKER
ncbi:MAG: hypothetical protein HETSPECPRED_002145 [Heterodermia speciosa]|uniref:Uncharacterized protein n=1 Tax=Heterodermia speciosa TaxID=116794 RepID=A0A8H3J3S4_9LECA|nr:MAG: hypothetical protein HETSPECPRED_002145 [Heterodermia speciosa]